jgi:L-ribulose-5-phosphate 3-epimerase
MSRMTLAISERAMPPGLTWRQKLDAAAKAGYDALELYIGESGEISDRLIMPYGLRRAICDFEHDSGVRIASICLSAVREHPVYSSDAGVRKRGMDILRSAVKLAEGMGINLIQLAGFEVCGDETESDAAKYLEESLLAAAEYAAATGVTVALGTGVTPPFDTVSKAACFVKRLGQPYLGLYPDIGNLINGIEPAEGIDAPGGLAQLAAADLESGRGDIFAAQLKETSRGVYEGLIPGEGRVDFGLMMAKLAELGVRRFTAVQQYTDDRAGCWEEDLRRTASYLRGVWSKRKVSAAGRANGD